MWPPPQSPPITEPARKISKTRAAPLKATRALASKASRLSVDRLTQLNKFVEGLLLGLPRREAALHAGVVTKSPKQLARKAWEMATDPYVRQTFAELREALAREKLCTFAEQVLDVKQIAFDQCIGVQGRIMAHKLLAELMGHEAPKKVQAEVKAGVLLIPDVKSMSDWERLAQEHQDRLKESKG